VIASFYLAAWITLLLLTITYFTSAPEEFDNFGFSILDIRVVKACQTFVERVLWKLWNKPFSLRAGEKTEKALQKAILLLSDQQLITGASICIVGLARLCVITQYHFNTILNLCLAASAAHSMTFSFVATYIKQNVFFRTWRAIAMLLFGMLLVGVWTVTGSRNWLEVYGLPALCGYKNIRQGFGGPALTSLVILYWFLIRGWAYALTVLFPGLVAAESVLLILSTTFWAAKVCGFLQWGCKKSACQLKYEHERLLETLEVLENSHLSLFLRIVRLISPCVLQGIWSFLCGVVLALFIIIYAASQVWASFAFALSWTCITFIGSVRIVASFRATAVANGMNGSENQWSFGQQLPLLMLILPAFAMAEFFFGKSPV
jgi:hypothetical protein